MAQIWANLPKKKMATKEILNEDVSVIDPGDGSTVRIVAGQYGDNSGAATMAYSHVGCESSDRPQRRTSYFGRAQHHCRYGWKALLPAKRKNTFSRVTSIVVEPGGEILSASKR